MLSDVVIDVERLSKRYGDFLAVKEVSFKVFKGEIFGLLGPNGAGKSTLINMLTCILNPSAGNAVICGFDLIKDQSEIKRIIGLIPQDIALYQSLSAIDNLSFFGSLHGLKGKKLKNCIEKAIAIAGLQKWAKRPVRTYSGGMKRRLNIAIALVHEPKVVFMDEPTVGVDPQSRNHIFETIKNLKKEGLTIIYTTHYMEEAQNLCDRVGIIDEGEIIALDTPRNLIKEVQRNILEIEVVNINTDMLEEIRKLQSIDNLIYRDGVIYITAENISKAAEEVFVLLNKNNASVTSISVPKANLEKVFLKYTGKSLRDS